MKFLKSNRIYAYLFLISTILLALSGCSAKNKAISEKANNLGSTYVSEKNHDVSVMFINVGKADSALIKVDEAAYLIDTGEKASASAVSAALEYCKIDHLNGVFLTHTHSDHIGGLAAISQRYRIDKLYSARISLEKKNKKNKIDKLSKKLSLDHKKLDAGDTVEVVKGIYFTVIAPLKRNHKEDNDNSMVLKLKANHTTFLFAGDMQFHEEKTLLKSNVDLSADILKVGDHGNADSTSPEFVAAVSPDIAVISTDTHRDKDSANKSVKTRLGKSKIYVTENYNLGVYLTISKNGTIRVTNPKRRSTSADRKVAHISQGLHCKS